MRKEWRTGTVVKYGSKRYGFIKLDGAKSDLFFHFNDGSGFTEREGEVAWSRSRVTRDPQEGDRVIVEIGHHKSRPAARPWGFLTAADKIKERMQKELAV